MKMILRKYGFALLMISMTFPGLQNIHAQNSLVAILDSATIDSQLDQLQQRTRIYNDFRAIREDIFLKIKGNVLDTLNGTKLEISHLNSIVSERNFQIETLNSDLSRTKNERDEAIKNKDSLSFFGIQTNKALYNTIMWFIVLGLAISATSMFFLFKRSHVITTQVKNELDTTQTDFEEHRKSSREKYEKLVVTHHSEIMRLKRS